ncbi:MAG: putative Ig domain-containing protein [Dehalococcoidales bacterium]|nr:putative Ig domain-containing protein [Dehalococcoidales bacterium]
MSELEFGSPPVPPPDPGLQLPGEQANQDFADAYKARAEAEGTVGSSTITSGNLGPLYIIGDLWIEGSVILTGPVYIEGSLRFDKEGILNGQGVIIARDNIECRKENTLAADPDTEIFFMALTGDIDLRKGQNAYNAMFYAPEGTISFKKDQTITGAIIAGDGFTTDKNLSVTYQAFNEETILPGYVALNPQLQTWDITIADEISITPINLPSCMVNTTYPGRTLVAVGGVAPYSWSVSSGYLPTGLALDGSTGTITGTPTTLGTFNFTITATDSTGKTGSKEYFILISS